MDTDVYKDASNLAKSEDFIKEHYKDFMGVAKEALLADAAHYAETGKHLPEMEQYGLLSYDRSQALSETVARRIARDNNLKYGEEHKHHIDMEEFVEDYDELDEKRINKASKFFK
jgi:hypothetical protein